MNKNNFGGVATRLVTGIAAACLAMLFIWRPPFPGAFGILVSVFAGFGLFEYYALVRARQISPETIGGILSGTLLALSGLSHSLGVVNVMLYGGFLIVSALHIARGQHSVAGLASSLFGIVYVGWLGAHIILLYTMHGGAGLVTLLLGAVALNDSAAYFVGSLIGKHKMAPKVSPKKTWEGAAGGLAAGLIGAAVLYLIRDTFLLSALPAWELGRYLYVGAMLAIVSQIGDLAESCLKRDAGVKDSGILFPGHGGVLDRCDGLLFAAPILYYIVRFGYGG